MNEILDEMIPFCPYLIRAVYDWLVDNNNVIYIELDTNIPNVFVPEEYIEEDGSIVLDVSPNAIDKIKILNSHVEFSARFGNKLYEISFPIESLIAIFCPDNDLGIKLQPTIAINIPLSQISYQDNNSYENDNLKQQTSSKMVLHKTSHDIKDVKEISKEHTKHIEKKPFLKILRNTKD